MLPTALRAAETTLWEEGQVFINQAAKEKTDSQSEEQWWETVEEDDVSYLLVVHQKLNSHNDVNNSCF